MERIENLVGIRDGEFDEVYQVVSNTIVLLHGAQNLRVEFIVATCSIVEY